MHPMWGVRGMWGVGMMLMMLVFWGVVIVGFILLIRWLDILRQRYARGDITREELEAKKKDLA